MTAACEFGEALPKLRAPRRAGPEAAQARPRHACSRRSSACSTREHIRVGNEQYAKDNKSFGADHAALAATSAASGGKLMMRFTGKHGIVHEATSPTPT